MVRSALRSVGERRLWRDAPRSAAPPARRFHPRRFPRTTTLLDQQAHSLSPEDTWWVELLETGIVWGAKPDRPDVAVSNEFEFDEDTQDIYGNHRARHRKVKGLYDQARETSPRLRNHSDHSLGRFLSSVGCVTDKHCGPSRTKRGWKLPPLKEARAQWETRFPGWQWGDKNLSDWEAKDDWKED